MILDGASRCTGQKRTTLHLAAQWNHPEAIEARSFASPSNGVRGRWKAVLVYMRLDSLASLNSQLMRRPWYPWALTATLRTAMAHGLYTWPPASGIAQPWQGW